MKIRSGIGKVTAPLGIVLKEAPSFGKTIFDYDKGSTGAEAYRELTREVLQRINKM
jgi:chromosome partitioning protein